jgi:hypothetical protein
MTIQQSTVLSTIPPEDDPVIRVETYNGKYNTYNVKWTS